MISYLRRFIGLTVGKIVLTAQLLPIKVNGPLKTIWAWLFYSHKEIYQLKHRFSHFKHVNHSQDEAHKLHVKRFKVKTEDCALLDTVELTHQAHKDSKKYVIYGWGRSGCKEKHLEQLASDALNLNAHIISFNYRGVGHSTEQPYGYVDLIEDYCAQIRHLIFDKKVSPENIYCYGHSLGGAIASIAAAKMHRDGYPVKVFADRSPADLIRVSTGVYFEKKRPRNMITLIGATIISASLLASLFVFSATPVWMLAGLSILTLASFKFDSLFQFWDKAIADDIDKAMRAAMRFGQWDMKAAAAFETIPDKDKNYAVIRGPQRAESKHGLGKKHSQDQTYDRVIHHKHSHHDGLDKRRQAKKELKKSLAEANQLGYSQEHIQAIRDKLILLSNAKMTGGGHSDRPKCFITRYAHPIALRPIDGRERFYDFVEPEGNKHVQKEPIQYKEFKMH